MTALIPTSIIDLLSDYIKIDASLDLNEKQEQRLIKMLVELWYFIYTRQIEEIEVKNLKFFVNIDRKELHSLFRLKINGQDISYKKLLDILICNNIISTNEKYRPGSFSKGYRVESDFLQTSNMTEFEVDFNKVFSNTQNKSVWLKLYPEHSSLIEDVYSSSVVLDDYLKWLQDNEGIELNPVLEKTGLRRRWLTKEAIYQHFNLALKLNLKNIWIKVSDQGRFYSTISNIAHTAVPFLLIDGRKTIDIDISNSQPLLMSVLLPEHLEYKKDVEAGIFYEKVAEQLNKMRPNKQISRNGLKMLVFRLIFFSPKPRKSGIVKTAMDSIYPGLVDAINKIKEDFVLSHKLQSMEADIFVNKIGKIKIKKLIRHDQVLVDEKNLPLIAKFLLLEYKRLNINLKIR